LSENQKTPTGRRKFNGSGIKTIWITALTGATQIARVAQITRANALNHMTILAKNIEIRQGRQLLNRLFQNQS